MTPATDRILTTHTGSLPRPDDLVEMMWKRLDGQVVDDAVLDARIRSAVGEVVDRQRTVGVDIVSDGEMSKVGFTNYIYERFSGFGGQASMERDDLADFPELADRLFGNAAGAHIALKNCVGPIELRGTDHVQRDIANFKDALGDYTPGDAFICAPSPGEVTFKNPNRYYPSQKAYLEAAAEAMRHEYKVITDAGFKVQLDSPDIGMSAHSRYVGSDLEDWRTHVELAIEALNHAVRGIPPEQLRLHVCWGNYAGPHHRDKPLREIIEAVIAASVGAISFEAANPRHAHEWEVFEEVRLPDDKVIVPGVIDVTTNYIEHPRLVAQRLIRFAQLVGRERVIAGTDCGFGTYVGWSNNVHPGIAWAKLETLAEGARIASDELWSRP